MLLIIILMLSTIPENHLTHIDLDDYMSILSSLSKDIYPLNFSIHNEPIFSSYLQPHSSNLPHFSNLDLYSQQNPLFIFKLKTLQLYESYNQILLHEYSQILSSNEVVQPQATLFVTKSQEDHHLIKNKIQQISPFSSINIHSMISESVTISHQLP